METINRIKGALADAHRTNRWLADQRRLQEKENDTKGENSQPTSRQLSNDFPTTFQRLSNDFPTTFRNGQNADIQVIRSRIGG